MKTLVLCRHAKSDWSHDLPDFDRPLNPRGLKDAPNMGRLLAKAGFNPDLILSSPANRALSTAKIIAQEIGYKAEIQTDRNLYDTGHGIVLGVIQSIPTKVETAMVFGHNPIFENLAKLLMRSEGNFVLPTCGMICFEAFAHSWRDIGATPLQIKWFVVPKMMGVD